MAQSPRQRCGAEARQHHAPRVPRRARRLLFEWPVRASGVATVPGHGGHDMHCTCGLRRYACGDVEGLLLRRCATSSIAERRTRTGGDGPRRSSSSSSLSRPVGRHAWMSSLRALLLTTRPVLRRRQALSARTDIEAPGRCHVVRLGPRLVGPNWRRQFHCSEM